MTQERIYIIEFRCQRPGGDLHTDVSFYGTAFSASQALTAARKEARKLCVGSSPELRGLKTPSVVDFKVPAPKRRGRKSR